MERFQSPALKYAQKMQETMKENPSAAKKFYAELKSPPLVKSTLKKTPSIPFNSNLKKYQTIEGLDLKFAQEKELRGECHLFFGNNKYECRLWILVMFY